MADIGFDRDSVKGMPKPSSPEGTSGHNFASGMDVLEGIAREIKARSLGQTDDLIAQIDAAITLLSSPSSAPAATSAERIPTKLRAKYPGKSTRQALEALAGELDEEIAAFPEASPRVSAATPAPFEHRLEVTASYVLGGWSKTIDNEQELLLAIEEGRRLSPVAEVSVRQYYTPEEREAFRKKERRYEEMLGVSAATPAPAIDAKCLRCNNDLGFDPDCDSCRRYCELQASAAERPAQTWQPIESAPKDRKIIGALIRDGVVWRVHDMKHNGLAFYTTSGGSLPQMTHWTEMPLHEPDAEGVPLRPKERRRE